MMRRDSFNQLNWLLAVLITTILLTACTSSNSSIVGKWEVVSGTNGSGISITDIGSLYEFFQDDTVSIDDTAGKYSWPDQIHIKIEAGPRAIIFTYNLIGEGLTLTNPSFQTNIVLKKYKEFVLSPQVIAGTWKHISSNNNDGCFKQLGIETMPQEIIFGADGTFSLNNNGSMLIGFGPSMNGQYNINGNTLHISASGTDATFSSAGQAQAIHGEFDCSVIVSNSRLTFQNVDGQNTLFVREGR